jgi:outer membrane protein OmpA-like peptidoglycan-associated protein
MRIPKIICLILAVHVGFNSYAQEEEPVRSNESISFDKVSEVTPGATYALRNIYFEIDRHKMTSESKTEMDRLVSVLKDNPGLKIHIEGHVCCVTKVPDALDVDTKEQKLSQNRAKEVYDYLVTTGIDAARLSYEGLGRSRPIIANETTEAEAAKNRRVEFKVMEE